MRKMFLMGVVVGLIGMAFVLDGAAQTRIRFARGRTSATVSGAVGGGGGVRRYVLGARAGQELSGNVSSRNGCVKFTEGSTAMSFTTESGDNWISVTNYCSRATNFVLTVSINY